MSLDALNQIPYSDGHFTEYQRREGGTAMFRFLDWREELWQIDFEEVELIEDFGLVGGDCDGVFIRENEEVRRRILETCDEEPDHRHFAEFVGQDTGKVELRVLAGSCRVSQVKS